MSLSALQKVHTWRNATKEARSAFVEATLDLQYGDEETRDAWDWFQKGWCAGYHDAPKETGL